ncbi:MAG: hypothetical protein JNJ49_00465 [Bdellovibrionaceae bacterium]|nr:hypothetical protein [Pseudobdellovibrionaceae bacterium]
MTMSNIRNAVVLLLCSSTVILYQNCGSSSFETQTIANVSDTTPFQEEVGVSVETTSSNPPSGQTTASTQEVIPASLLILRPLKNEVIDLKESSLTVHVNAGTAIPQVSYQILTGSTILQSGVLLLSGGIFNSEVALNTAVRAHRGSFLKFRIGTKENAFGLGYLFLVAGQSNTVNSECRECGTPSQATGALVVALQDSKIDPGITTKDSSQIIWPSTIGTRILSTEMNFVPLSESPRFVQGSNKSIWSRVGASLSAQYNVPVGFIIVGLGGTSISQWSGELFKLFQYGNRLKLTSILWDQGESDALNKTSGSLYTSTLQSIINRTRTQYGRTVPWVISQTSSCIVQEPAATFATADANIAAIEKAQIDFINSMKNATSFIYAGPNTNRIFHRCHFDTQLEFDTFTAAWTSSIKTNGVLTKATPAAQLSQSTRRGLLPIYRAYNPISHSHLFSFVDGEGDAYGFTRNGVGFFVFKPASNRGSNYVTLYRCRDLQKGIHFVSKYSNCEGKTFDLTLGQIYQGPVGILLDPTKNMDVYLAKPLYRCIGSLVNLTTPVRAECENSSFSSIETLGYMPFE